jgi:hypothetical protein
VNAERGVQEVGRTRKRMGVSRAGGRLTKTRRARPGEVWMSRRLGREEMQHKMTGCGRRRMKREVEGEDEEDLCSWRNIQACVAVRKSHASVVSGANF